jgi:hypothetical protein
LWTSMPTNDLMVCICLFLPVYRRTDGGCRRL